MMKIRKVKKKIKRLKCVMFKNQALMSLKSIKIWSRIESNNSKSNMKILTKNFMFNGEFINNGVW